MRSVGEVARQRKLSSGVVRVIATPGFAPVSCAQAALSRNQGQGTIVAGDRFRPASRAACTA